MGCLLKPDPVCSGNMWMERTGNKLAAYLRSVRDNTLTL